MPRGPRVDPEVRQIIARLVAEGEDSPAAISRVLERQLYEAYGDKKGAQFPQLPSQRTVARIVRELKRQSKPEDDRPWSLAEASPEEAAAIMPVLGAELAALADLADMFQLPAEAVKLAKGGPIRLTVGLAKWIVKVAAAAPTLPPLFKYFVAREYRAAELWGQRAPTSPAALDALLACRPWESEEAARRYARLLELGVIEPAGSLRTFTWSPDITLYSGYPTMALLTYLVTRSPDITQKERPDEQ